MSARSGGEHPEADISFYDLAAQERILPVLYSQRYDYYLEIGCAITDRIEPAQRVLDFGCGVGMLTTFYAWSFPHITFVGVDRSPGSIARASDEAAKRGLSNVQFETRHIPPDDLSDSFDLVISTQTLFQAERDPGLPSQSWKTMERACDPTLQMGRQRFEPGSKTDWIGSRPWSRQEGGCFSVKRHGIWDAGSCCKEHWPLEGID